MMMKVNLYSVLSWSSNHLYMLSSQTEREYSIQAAG